MNFKLSTKPKNNCKWWPCFFLLDIRHNEDFFAEEITNLIHAKFGSNWSHSLSGDDQSVKS